MDDNCGVRFHLRKTGDGKYDVLIVLDYGDSTSGRGAGQPCDSPVEALTYAIQRAERDGYIASMMTHDELAAKYDI